MENCMGWDPKTHGALWKKYEDALRKWLDEHRDASWNQFLNYAKQLSKNMQNGGG
jgi:vacuolar-type H+-ATPase catalytic subunit A/Vma1